MNSNSRKENLVSIDVQYLILKAKEIAKKPQLLEFKRGVLRHYIGTLKERERAEQITYVENMGKELIEHWGHYRRLHCGPVYTKVEESALKAGNIYGVFPVETYGDLLNEISSFL